MAGVAATAKTAGRIARGGSIVGSLFGVVLNEIFDVNQLKDLRKETIEKYRKGEISREDAEKALKEIDDHIAESRGGSIGRGAVSGAGGALGGTLGLIGGGGVASAVTGTAGAIGGSMLADKLLGGYAEKAGGFISRQLFGASNRGINRELDEISQQNRQTGQPRQQAQQGRLTESRSEFRIAGKAVTEGQPLSEDQMAAIEMALTMSPENARGYPAWVLEQYNKQKSQGGSGAVGSVSQGAINSVATNGALNRPADVRQTSTDENELR